MPVDASPVPHLCGVAPRIGIEKRALTPDILQIRHRIRRHETQKKDAKDFVKKREKDGQTVEKGRNRPLCFKGIQTL